jgi:hypothetical protein
MPAKRPTEEVAALEIPCRDQTFRGQPLLSLLKKMRDAADVKARKVWIRCEICAVQRRFDGCEDRIPVWIEKHKHPPVPSNGLERYGFTLTDARNWQKSRREALTSKLVMMAAGNMSFNFAASDELRDYELRLVRLGQQFPSVDAPTLLQADTRQSLATAFKDVAAKVSDSILAPLREAGLAALIFDESRPERPLPRRTFYPIPVY